MNHEILSNLPAERAVIGSVLLDPDAMSQVSDLAPEAFFGVAERATWEALRALDTAGKRPSDPMVVADQLVRQGDAGKFPPGAVSAAEAVAAGLTDWMAGTSAAANVGHYADLVRDRWKARQLLQIAAGLTAGIDRGGEASELLGRLESDVAAVAEGRARIERVAEWDAFTDELEQRVIAAGEGRRSDGLGVPTGIGTCDRVFLGAAPGNTIVVAGEPGGGKSTFARQWAWNLCLADGASLIFSLEMNRAECMEAIYAHDSKIGSYKLAHGYVQQAEWAPLLKTSDRVKAADLVIDDESTDIAKIESVIAQWAARTKGKRRMWFVDYVQLVTASDMDRRSNRSETIAAISRRLKLIAKRTNTAGVLVAQLNRAGLKSMSEPTMHDLEGSGSLEKDASVIAFLSIARDDKGVPTGEAAFRVMKQRRGPTGKELLRWNGPTYTFSAEDASPTTLGPARSPYGSGGDDF